MDSGGCGNSFDRDDNNQPSSFNSGGNQQQHPIENSNGHQDHPPISRKIIIRMTLLFTAVAVACFVLYNSDYRNQYLLITWRNPLSSTSQGTTKTNQISLPPGAKNFSNSPDELLQGNNKSSMLNLSSPTNSEEETLPSLVNQENEERKLEKVLNKAAMANKTVIIAALNAAWIAPNSIFDLFLESFKIGNGTQRLLNHVVVMALDQKAYSRCLELHSHCYVLNTEGVDFSGAANFMTPDYLKITWRKIELVQTILHMGYNCIFTDIDILWFRDPFSHFLRGADIQVSSDHYEHSSTDLENIANTGFYYVKSNKKTIQFYKLWYESKDKLPDRHDQDVFNMIRHDPIIKKIGLKIKFLDTAFYGGFCEPSKDINVVCTMHANCCGDLDSKIHDLKMLLDDWKKYMAFPSEESTTEPQSWTIPRICG
ncbi:hypothetical protein ACH5RR_040667 [Cinchona calisaya]|uniref:Nucleotide-diphospho-sugar transferase domain-containing protein n=1 Tax=Cinchona calisaya TaxID=153742 RepID=A0ABD2XWN7_9GENT